MKLGEVTRQVQAHQQAYEGKFSTFRGQIHGAGIGTARGLGEEAGGGRVRRLGCELVYNGDLIRYIQCL